MLRALIVSTIILTTASCASPPPQQPDDICEIFREKSGWYKSAVKAEKRWGTPVSILMAFVHRESSYVAKAKPPRTKLLKVIPWKRPSSAYGYAQATDQTWKNYKKATHSPFADRNDFGDALDFIGWYNQLSRKRLGLARTNAFALYIAYHEGRGGYASGRWKHKKKLISRVRRVESRAASYQTQYNGCVRSLKRRGHWWWPFG